MTSSSCTALTSGRRSRSEIGRTTQRSRPNGRLRLFWVFSPSPLRGGGRGVGLGGRAFAQTPPPNPLPEAGRGNQTSNQLTIVVDTFRTRLRSPAPATTGMSTFPQKAGPASGHHHQSLWLWVMCLTGVDYFS